MEDKIQKYIEEYQMLTSGDHCVVGVSGGADSVCLFLVLMHLAEKLNITLHVVHINHLLRGDAADRDEDMVKILCEKYQVPFHSFHIDVKALAKEWGMTIEEAGRTVRYQCFEQVSDDIKQKKIVRCRIAVAHNKNDMAETVIMNLLRGTGLAGATSIPPVRGQIIRPLLCVDRSEIEIYLKGHDQSFCVDDTNFKMDYTRNKIRHKILPHMTEINSRAIDHLCSFAGLSGEYLDYVSTQVEAWLEKKCIGYHDGSSKYAICIDELKKADNLIENLALKKIISLCCSGTKDIGSSHISEVKKLYSSISGSKIMLPHGTQVTNEYGKLCFYRGKDGAAESEDMTAICIKGEGMYPLPDSEQVLKVSILESPFNIDFTKKEYTKYIDYDKIRNDIYLRNYTENDYIVIDFTGATKKMNRLFSSYKIPQAERKKIPLIVSGSEVIWAIGLRIGENYKVDDNTKKIICFEIRRKG